MSALDEAAVAAIARAIAPHLADNRTPRDHDGAPVISLRMYEKADRIARALLPLWAKARRDALEEAARMADEVYIGLIGWDAQVCGCGNGRVPTGSFRKAVDAYAVVIRSLDPLGGAS